MTVTYNLTELARIIGCELDAHWQDRGITGLASLETANKTQLSFVSDSKYKKYLASTEAAAVIVTSDMANDIPSNTAVLIHADPYLAYAKLSHVFRYRPAVALGIHPSAVVAKSARIASTAAIGAQAVIEEGVVIGENVVIGPSSVIGAHSIIENDTYLHARVTLYHHTQVGKNVILHSGVVLGADGFGFAPERGQWVKIEQLGQVIIEDEVEILLFLSLFG